MKIAKFKQTILVVPCLYDVWSFRPLRWDAPTSKWTDIELTRLKPDRVDGYKYIMKKVASIMEEDGWNVELIVEEIDYADAEVSGVYKIFNLTCSKEETPGEEIAIDTESLFDCAHTGFSGDGYCKKCGDHFDDMLEVKHMGRLYEGNKSKGKSRGVSSR